MLWIRFIYSWILIQNNLWHSARVTNVLYLLKIAMRVRVKNRYRHRYAICAKHYVDYIIIIRYNISILNGTIVNFFSLWSTWGSVVLLVAPLKTSWDGIPEIDVQRQMSGNIFNFSPIFGLYPLLWCLAKIILRFYHRARRDRNPGEWHGQRVARLSYELSPPTPSTRSFLADCAQKTPVTFGPFAETGKAIFLIFRPQPVQQKSHFLSRLLCAKRRYRYFFYFFCLSWTTNSISIRDSVKIWFYLE